MGNQNSSSSKFLDGCPKIPAAPAKNLVQMRFDELLLTFFQDPVLRTELDAAETIETKWKCAFLSKLPLGSVAEDWLSPRECVELAQRLCGDDASCIHDLYLAIRISIMLRPSTWVETFVLENGVEKLIAPLKVCGGAATEIYNDILSTLLVLINSSVGISALLQIPESCSLLYSVFDLSFSSEIKSRSLKVLELLCRKSASATDTVMASFLSNEHQSLQSLVIKLEQNKSDAVFQLAVVKFVNALLETSHDKRQRTLICEKLRSNGFVALLESFKSRNGDFKNDHPLVRAQIKEFQKNFSEMMKDDEIGTLRVALGDALNCSPPTCSATRASDLAKGNQSDRGEVGSSMDATLEKKNLSSSNPSNKEPDDSSVTAHSVLDYVTLDNAFDQLQDQCKNLDQETSESITKLLQKLTVRLSKGFDARQTVDRLDKILSSAELDANHDKYKTNVKEEHPETAETKLNQEPDLFTRMSLALFPSFGDPQVQPLIVESSASGRPLLFSGFEDFSLSSLIPTPAKNSVLKSSLTSFIGARAENQLTESFGTRAKLSLPFFQSSRKGPGLGATPACTPVATPSVRKDAKRPEFPSFSSPPQEEVTTASYSAQSSDSVAMSAPTNTPSTTLSTLPSAENISTLTLDVLKPALAIEPNAITSPVTQTDCSKFRKLLMMGAPREAVRAKMQQAGVDPNLLDEQQGFNPKVSDLPAKKEVILDPYGDVNNNHRINLEGKFLHKTVPSQVRDIPAFPTVRTSPGPDIADFKRLLLMGAPLAADKDKMIQAGLDPALLNDSVTLIESAPSVKLKIKDDPTYAKFFKLLSMGAPVAAVKTKMQQAGLESNLLDQPDAYVPTDTAVPSPNTSLPIPIKPLPLLSNTLDARVITQSERQVKVKDDPRYAKFYKLLSMGAPPESVKLKMQMERLQPELLDTPEAFVGPAPCLSEVATLQSEKMVKDDSAYAKFFKLLSMGAPVESVKAKMRIAGLEPDLLDTPNGILKSSGLGNQSLSPAINPNSAVRRGQLSIAIKPTMKAKTRSFYWRHLKTEDIEGTIWEELHKENHDLAFLTENELGLLETEFPPPADLSTGTRRGSFSAADPVSPLASPRVVFLIDRARSNNISIIIKQFRMSNAALRVAIMKMDSEVLTLDRVQGLIRILPTEDDIEAITGFNGDPITLNGAELVLKELISVPRLKQRLSALETKHQFPALMRDLQTKIDKIRAASNEIAQSRELKTILMVILQVGNRMNHGTARGGAKGFRLNDLSKLVQLKSVDKSITLLHYVTRMVRIKKNNAIRLGDSLSSLYDVQSISIPELQGDMNRINDLAESISVELAAQRLRNRIEEKEEIDLFVESMTSFVDDALKEVITLKTNLDDMIRLMRDTMMRFDKSTDEDEKSLLSADAPITPMALARAGEFFSVIYEFTMSLTKADRENELKRIRDEKRLKQQEQKKCITPRRASTDLSTLIKSREKADAPETRGTNSSFAVTTSSSTPPNRVTFIHTDTEEANIKSSLSLVVSKQTSEGKSGAYKTDETQFQKRSDGVKKEKKAPGELVKAAAVCSTSPFRKVSETMPTGIPSPKKFMCTLPSVSTTEKCACPTTSTVFFADLLDETKSKQKSNDTAKNKPQVLHGLKPEVEVENDDYDNNNNESSSPEKALSEADPSTREASHRTTCTLLQPQSI